MNKEKRIATARAALLAWHAESGRHSLPWRRNHSAYEVLVSEFMLQQTTVTTVIPRFASWMLRFPSLPDLAAATEEEVLAEWQGLGYYSRARRLRTTALAVMERHSGILPCETGELLSLPGVGAYTAAAIRAFAHDLHAVVLDTNIIRVLSRWANLQQPVDTAEGRKSLEEIATSFYPSKGCRAVASALMDLGATLCVSGTPDCTSCPLQKTCRAEQPEKLPLKSPRPVTLAHRELRAWFFHEKRLYLELSEGPRWRGLWILPELGEVKARGIHGGPLAEITYPITRYRVTMRVYETREAPPAHLRGFTSRELASIPIPTPHRRAIEAVAKHGFPVHSDLNVPHDA